MNLRDAILMKLHVCASEHTHTSEFVKGLCKESLQITLLLITLWQNALYNFGNLVLILECQQDTDINSNCDTTKPNHTATR
jgi:hypothetical protein